MKVTLRDYTICKNRHRMWMLDHLYTFLRSLEQFNDVNDYTLERLAAHCNVRRLGRHEALLKCGQQLSCFVLKSGMLRVLVRNGSAGFVELARLGVETALGVQDLPKVARGRVMMSR